MVHNVHEREIAARRETVGALIDSLGSKADRLWPREAWPAMRLDAPLGVGAAGGHGPVRYTVTRYEPGLRVEFRFTGPAGFHGHHAFVASARAEGSTLLRHELTLSPTGPAIVTWPLFFRPLHDALIEECLDRAEHECGTPPRRPYRRTAWTKLLRASFAAQLARRRGRR